MFMVHLQDLVNELKRASMGRFIHRGGLRSLLGVRDFTCWSRSGSGNGSGSGGWGGLIKDSN